MPLDVPPDCSAYTVRIADMPVEERLIGDFFAKLDERMTCERLAGAQWSPITDAAAQGRQVRRVAFQDSTATFVVPVTVEREADGEVMVRVTTGSGSTLSGPAPANVWAALAKLDAVTRPAPARGAVDASSKLQCPDIKVEVADNGASWSRSAFGCDLQDGFASYAYEIAKIAAQYIPRCSALPVEGPNPFISDDPASLALAPLARCVGAVRNAKL